MKNFNPVALREKAWLRHPYPFRETSVDRAQDFLSFEYVGQLIDKMEANDIIYRTSSNGAIGSQLSRLPFDDALITDLEGTLNRTSNSLMLQFVDRYDLKFAELVERYLKEIADALAIDFSAIHKPTASFFLSSPNVISPFHTDREQNFLVHLHGVKTMYVVPQPWRSTLGEIGEALFRPRKGIAPEFNSQHQKSAQSYQLEPGTSIYVPRIMPHWVINGPQAAMSLSINFFCTQDFVMERFYDANDKLRSLYTKLFQPAKNT